MGGLCPFSKNDGKPEKNVEKRIIQNQPKSTQRAINQIPRKNSDQQTVSDKKNQLNDSMRSSTTARADRVAKNPNTTQSSSVFQRKPSSLSLLFQGGLFERQSIILKNSRDDGQQKKKQSQQYYVFIDNLFFVKKSNDEIKVVSPHGQSRLKCPVTNVSSVYYLTEGTPLDTIKPLSNLKFIQVTESPIITKLLITCKNCTNNYIINQQNTTQNNQISKSNVKSQEQNTPFNIRKIKLTFSASTINLRQLPCQQCQHVGQWNVLSIQSNFTIWGNGHKICNGEALNQVPSTIRIMGCINCLRYSESVKLNCGCLMCKNCCDEIQSQQCRLCETVLRESF